MLGLRRQGQAARMSGRRSEWLVKWPELPERVWRWRPPAARRGKVLGERAFLLCDGNRYADVDNGIRGNAVARRMYR